MKKEEIEEYLKSQVQEAKEKAKIVLNTKIILDQVEFLNTYTFLDYIFPIHTFFDTKDQVPELGTNYPCTFRYLNMKRIEFLHLLNHKYQKYLSDSDREILKSIEYKHFIYSFSSYIASFIVLFAKPFQKLKLLRFYAFSLLFFPAPWYSIFLISRDFIPLKQKVMIHKPFNIGFNDLFDYTLIPDWRTYLYYYNYL